MYLKLIVFFALVLVLTATVVPQSTQSRQMPRDFKSDGCSFFLDCNYRECCVEHDKDYYFGGTGAERKASDKRLYKCVKAKNKFAAPLMWLGVRVGGVSFLPTPFRWGFGVKKEKKPVKTQ